MDVQPGIVDRVPNKDEFLQKVDAAVAAAHAKNIPVLYVVVGFRAGFPEVSPSNKMFGSMPKEMMAAFVNPQPIMTPIEGDTVITKRRVSAFAGSDLEVILRAKGINHVVLAGIATSGVVLSTLREAADKDYQITVLKDLCSDTDPDVQNILLEKIFPRQGVVMTSEEWIGGMSQ